MMSSVSNSVNDGVVTTRTYSDIKSVLEIPNLIQVQVDSFNWFMTDGLRELLDEISPIEDFPGGRFELTFQDHYFGEPKNAEHDCREKEITYSAPLYVTVKLKISAKGPAQG